MSKILNRKATKQLILKRAEVLRPGWMCKRVSAAALNQIEAFIRVKVDESIHKHPSRGKTFKNFD